MRFILQTQKSAHRRRLRERPAARETGALLGRRRCDFDAARIIETIDPREVPSRSTSAMRWKIRAMSGRNISRSELVDGNQSAARARSRARSRRAQARSRYRLRHRLFPLHLPICSATTFSGWTSTRSRFHGNDRAPRREAHDLARRGISAPARSRPEIRCHRGSHDLLQRPQERQALEDPRNGNFSSTIWRASSRRQAARSGWN